MRSTKGLVAVGIIGLVVGAVAFWLLLGSGKSSAPGQQAMVQPPPVQVPQTAQVAPPPQAVPVPPAPANYAHTAPVPQVMRPAPIQAPPPVVVYVAPAPVNVHVVNNVNRPVAGRQSGGYYGARPVNYDEYVSQQAWDRFWSAGRQTYYPQGYYGPGPDEYQSRYAWDRFWSGGSGSGRFFNWSVGGRHHDDD